MPWSALGWYAGAAVVLKVVADAVGPAYLRPVPPGPAAVVAAVLAVAVVSGGALWFAVAACGGGGVGLRRLAGATGTLLPDSRPRAWVPLSVAAGLVALGVAVAVRWALAAQGWSDPPPDGPVRAATEDAPLWGQVLLAFVLTSLPEELIFRGVLLGYLARRPAGPSRFGGVAAVLVTSALFGLLHLPQGTGAAVQTSVSSLLFGALAVRYGSVWPAVVAHGTHNVVVFAFG